MPLIAKQQPPYYSSENTAKIYTALLSQNGTAAPTATIIQNTIGNIIWTRDSEGFYLGTLAAAFPKFKTLIFITTTSGALTEAGNNEQGEPSDEIYVRTGIDGGLYITPITILIYP